MTNEEINRTIAEFMGLKEIAIYYIDENRWSGGNSLEYTTQKCNNYKSQGINCELRERVIATDEYTESLDALVPVWEKLKYNLVWLEESKTFSLNCIFEASAKTIQQAAAHATAKAILESSKE